MEVVFFAENTAYDFYKQGVSFLEAAWRCFANENCLISDEPILMFSPIAVNASFACEMFLKALMHSENKQKKTHNLFELYNSLSAGKKKKLYLLAYDEEPMSETEYQQKTEALLKKYAGCFEQVRYVVEKPGKHSIQITEILFLAYNLCSLTQEIVKRNETNGETRRRLYDCLRKYTED